LARTPIRPRDGLLRPYGLVIDGNLELGLELLFEDGRIHEIRPHTGIPEAFVVSPALVNAHSHLEYRGLQGRVAKSDYWSWIRALTQLKGEQDLESVATDANRAAEENRTTGVGFVSEHSDRPVAADALSRHGLRAEIFQEVITLLEHTDPGPKLEAIEAKAQNQRNQAPYPVTLSPHALYTVDGTTLSNLMASGGPVSIHLAETDLENLFTRRGEGPIAELYHSLGVPFEPTGESVLRSLVRLGPLGPNVQLVHCCALDEDDLELLATFKPRIAHCPRSNENLNTPAAPLREMLDLGLCVGIGLDSAASSGPIDMFAEMRSALAISLDRGRPLHPPEVWRMAAEMGARSTAHAGGSCWAIERGSDVPLIAIHHPSALCTDDLIQAGAPEFVQWIDPSV
jgi:cytosine/adenosine deaminase-related metal-dependent hydrolase